jgi:putative membrane protein
MLKRTLIVAVCCVGGLPIFAKTAQPMSDASFVRKAAQSNYAEIQLGKLAQDKASNPAVKEFGQRMVTDHTTAYDQLKPIASKDNLSMPSNMSAKDQALYNHLSKLSGSQFDRSYMQAMVKDHKMDVSEFQHEAQTAQNPDVRSYASNTLSVLQQHLQLAESTNSKVSASASK